MQRRALLAAGALAACGALPAHADEGALERVRRAGRLVVAVYQEMPPFNDKGQGIDVDLAGELARAVGVPLSLLPFPAGESMGDDLRNAVWKGHYLGWGPADLMLHVPMDRPLVEANPQVEIFGPYYRETLALAWDTERGGPVPETASELQGKQIAVSAVSLAGVLLASAEGGALRETLHTRLNDGVEAAKLLVAGEVVGAAGLASELEAVLSAQPRYQIKPLPVPRAPRNGWVVGCAVKRGATDLARVVQQRLEELYNGPGLRDTFKRHGVVWRG